MKQVHTIEKDLKIPTRCVVCGEPLTQERLRYKAITCNNDHAELRKGNMKRGDASCRCVICGDQVPADRVRFGAITCSEQHKRMRKASIRARRVAGRCDFCHKPSTPAERAAFTRFRSIELSRPDLLYPTDWQKWQSGGGDLKAFADQIEQNAIKLKLATRANKDTPGGENVGRPRLRWIGGDPECQHQRRHQREGRKELKPELASTCARGCGAKLDKGEMA